MIIGFRRFIVVCAILTGASLGLTGIAQAQEASLSGTVTDTTGGVLPGATVTATHQASGNTFVSVTDERGVYRLGLRTGVYQINVELQGFATVIRTGLELLVGQQAVVPVQMAAASLQESVTVTGEAPLVETSKSSLGGNIDPRQLAELPVNGRNWMDLTMLAPGARSNNITETPDSSFQLNLDGQDVTQIVSPGFAQPRYSMDSIAEFQFVSSRFDATQGRTSGIQVNAVTKSGTNVPSGSLASYFRNDRMNAADFIQHRVLPYSDQQVSATFGGPIRKDRAHFFANYEYERNPQTFAYSSPYPSFNIDLSGPIKQHKVGLRLDFQFSPRTRLSVRGNKYTNHTPYDSRYTGGATRHPSSAIGIEKRGNDLNLNLTRVLTNRAVNEAKVGYNGFYWVQNSVVNWPNDPLADVKSEPWAPNGITLGAPIINLQGYAIGQGHTQTPLLNGQDITSLRDDVTLGAGRHNVKIGAEYFNFPGTIFFCNSCMGILDATGGPAPANLEALFPVWNDVSTWNLNPLSPISRSYQRGVGSWKSYTHRDEFAGWLQDDWTINQKLTLNLGLRYDFAGGVFANDVALEPFLKANRPNDTNNWSPRLGFAYGVTSKTVVRGGFGKYFTEVADTAALWTYGWSKNTIVQVQNDGRPNFASNPFNGPAPTYEQVAASGFRRTISSSLASPTSEIPYTYQASIGFQRQLGETMSFQADYVESRARRTLNGRNINLAYSSATGANYAFTDVAHLPYPGWAQVVMNLTDGASNYHALQAAFTKRLSNRWQASGTYTFSREFALRPSPINPGCQYPMTISATAAPVCNAPIALAPDLAAEWFRNNTQTHRAVVNGIWQAAYGFQLSGLYMFGDNGRDTAQAGLDVRNIGATNGLLRANGTLIPRNGINRGNIHRADVRLLRRFQVSKRFGVDGVIDVFNLFNHANYGTYVTNERNAKFGQPTDDTGTAYQPRVVQLGFRATF